MRKRKWVQCGIFTNFWLWFIRCAFSLHKVKLKTQCNITDETAEKGHDFLPSTFLFPFILWQGYFLFKNSFRSDISTKKHSYLNFQGTVLFWDLPRITKTHITPWHASHIVSWQISTQFDRIMWKYTKENVALQEQTCILVMSGRLNDGYYSSIIRTLDSKRWQDWLIFYSTGRLFVDAVFRKAFGFFLAFRMSYISYSLLLKCIIGTGKF